MQLKQDISRLRRKSVLLEVWKVGLHLPERLVADPPELDIVDHIGD